jgi:hypothetical protein
MRVRDSQDSGFALWRPARDRNGGPPDGEPAIGGPRFAFAEVSIRTGYEAVPPAPAGLAAAFWID